jgi:translocation and assembly module TamA
MQERVLLSLFLLQVILAGLPLVLSAAGQGLQYEVNFVGIQDEDLLDELRAVARSIEYQERYPATQALLERRVEGDVSRFRGIMQSHGYFGAEITCDLIPDERPIQVVYRIKPGPVYQLTHVDFGLVRSASKAVISLPRPHEVGLEVNQAALPDEIISAQQQLLLNVREQGYPFPEMADRKVIVDHATQTVQANFIVNPATRAVFGPITVEGLETVDEQFVLNRVQWERGELFNTQVIEETQEELVKSNLFSVVRVNFNHQINEQGELPITILLTERKHRTIGAGISYYTDEGVGGRVSWENRNLQGKGERLSVEGMASFIEFAGEVAYRKPDFLRRDQSLLLNTRIAYDDPKPYTSRNFSTSALVERILNEEMRLSAGVSYRIANITQLNTNRDFGLLSLPVRYEWDHSDDLLNPTEGFRWMAEVEPFYDTFGGVDFFFKGYTRYSHYYRILDDPMFVLAGLVGFGSITGGSLFELPADERFYAGGGGSIRGYEYQTVSPLIGDHPVGGRSILELSLELRWNLTRTIGLVTFLDGGTAFVEQIPDFDETIRWGTGIGFRYFTPIGPLRFDIGFPINPRDDIDSLFQLYISIGQAF